MGAPPIDAMGILCSVTQFIERILPLQLSHTIAFEGIVDKCLLIPFELFLMFFFRCVLVLFLQFLVCLLVCNRDVYLTIGLFCEYHHLTLDGMFGMVINLRGVKCFSTHSGFKV